MGAPAQAAALAPGRSPSILPDAENVRLSACLPHLAQRRLGVELLGELRCAFRRGRCELPRTGIEPSVFAISSGQRRDVRPAARQAQREEEDCNSLHRSSAAGGAAGVGAGRMRRPSRRCCSSERILERSHDRRIDRVQWAAGLGQDEVLSRALRAGSRNSDLTNSGNSDDPGASSDRRGPSVAVAPRRGKDAWPDAHNKEARQIRLVDEHLRAPAVRPSSTIHESVAA